MNRLLKFANRIATDARSDRALLEALASSRDGDALAELFRRHAAAVRRAAADVCPAAADEVVQSAFLLLADRAGTLTGRVSAAGWLFQVARRLALKARTAAARRARHEARVPPPAGPAPVLDDLAFREVRALVAEELGRLPERLRVPLVLHYWEGAGHAEAAARLGCSVSTLKRLLDAGRERLGARLARRGLGGAGVLAALAGIQARAMAGPPPGAAPVPGAVTGTACAAALGRAAGGAGGLGVAKGFALTAGVLAAGAALALGLAAPKAAPHPVTAAAPEEKPPTDTPGVVPAPGPARADLPAGAVARLGSDRFLHHGGLVGRVFVAPDGRHAVSIGSDAIMSVSNVKTKLWDMRTLAELPLAGGKLPETPGGVRVVTAVPVGRTLALVVAPRDLAKSGGAGPWLIDAVGGEVLADLANSGYADGVAVHPGGKVIAVANVRGAGPEAAGRKYEVFLRDLTKKKEPVAIIRPQARDIKLLQFSRDGRYLAVQYAGGAGIDVVDVGSAKLVLSAPDTDTSDGPYDRFDFSPDGKSFAKEDRGAKTLRTWTLADGKERPAIRCEDGHWGRALVFDATGGRLGHPTEKRTFRLYDLATGLPAWDVACDGGFLGGFDAAFTSDGNFLVTAEREDLVLRIAKTGKAIDSPDHRADIAHLDWAQDGRTVVTWDGGSERPGRMWDAATGRMLGAVSGHADGYGALATAPGGAIFATSGTRVRNKEGDGSVRLRSTADGKEVASFRPKFAEGDPGVRHLWFAPDGKTLFGLAREAGYAWDVAARREARSFAHPFARVSEAYPVGGGDRVIVSGWLPRTDGLPVNVTNDPLVVLTLDLGTGKELGRRIEFGQDGLCGVSPDGRFYLRTRYTSPRDHRAEVWDSATGRPVCPLPGADGTREAPRVATGAFARDGRTFSIGLSDGTIRVYEWATRTERLRFDHGARVRAVVYSPDGLRLASAGSRWGLVWNLTAPQDAKTVSETDAWAALAQSDGRAGLAAVRYFVDRPGAAVGFFKDRVRPVPAPDPKQVARWVEQLGSDDFAEREAASKQLTGVAEPARSQLSAAAAKTESPEVSARLARVLAPLGEERPLTGESLRAARVVEALETIRTPAARDLLKSLAGGAPEARLTRGAAGALKRLETTPN